MDNFNYQNKFSLTNEKLLIAINRNPWKAKVSLILSS